MARREHSTETFGTIGGSRPDDDIEPYEAYADATSYDYGYEEAAGPPAARILWGRVALLAGGVIVAFLLGRMTADGGIPETRYQQAVDAKEAAQADLSNSQDELTAETNRADAAEQKVQDLQAQVDAATTTDTGTTTDTAADEGKTYVVQPGDTFRGLANKFYDDP